MNNIFESATSSKIIDRINQLDAATNSLWGTMDVAQMLAHCNVTYDMVYTQKYPKPNSFKRFMLTKFVKKVVVGDKPYAKNGRTAPEFVITSQQDFDKEKKILLDYITKTQNLGESHFQDKESHSFGKLSSAEWNNLFYKHLDHHLVQFGV